MKTKDEIANEIYGEDYDELCRPKQGRIDGRYIAQQEPEK